MTQRQKLDVILTGLMSRLPMRYEHGADYKILTFEFLCSVLFKDDKAELWEMEYLKDFLINDGYIKMIDVNGTSIPDLTHKGKKFILDGGYVKEHNSKNLQEELIKTTINSNNRSKWALLASIASFVVAFAALIIGLLNK